MERKMAESVGRSEQQCGLFAEELAVLQEAMEAMTKGQVANAREARTPRGESSEGGLQALAKRLEEEREARLAEVEELRRSLSYSDRQREHDQRGQFGEENAMNSLTRGLEDERRTRMEEIQELGKRIEDIAAGAANHARSASATVDNLTSDLEQECRARSGDFQEIHRQVEELA